MPEYVRTHRITKEGGELVSHVEACEHQIRILTKPFMQ